MIQTNQWHNGIDCDTYIKYVEDGRLVDAMNVWLMSKGDNHAACVQDSTAYCFNIGTGQYNAIQAYGNKGGENVSGAVIFSDDGRVYFFDIANKDLCLIAKGFDFQGDIRCLTPQAYNDGLCSTVYWTDGTDFRQLEIDCDTEPEDLRKTFLRPENPIDCLEYGGVSDDGSLIGGSYQFAYRYYNKETCRYSNYSTFTNAIPVIPKNGCVPDSVGGARVAQQTGRSINLLLPTNEGGECFDSIQLLVIKNTDGTRIQQTIGYLLPPSESFYQTREFVYDGSSVEVQTDLADILVDDLALIGADTILQYRDRIIYANPMLNRLEADNGPVQVANAETIKMPLGEIKYLPDEILRYDFEMTEVGLPEGAEYGLEFEVMDNDFEWHNLEIIEPSVDLNTRGSETVTSTYEGRMFTHYGRASLVGLRVSSYAMKDGCLYYGEGVINEDFQIEIQLSPQDAYRQPYQCEDDYKYVGHFRDEQYAYGVRYLDRYGNSIVCPLDLSAFEGNQSDHWAWKFPDRQACPLFGEDGRINAMGLHISGITNHPSWAVSMEIVRRRRIENIVYQTPHIPLVGIEGVSTSYSYQQEGEFEDCPDYDAEFDHVIPKIFRIGHATNLVQCDQPALINDAVGGFSLFGIPLLQAGDAIVRGFWFPSWERQCEDTGKGEVSNGMFVVAPEVIYNVDGESFDARDMQGLQVRIVDAVYWRARKIQELRKWVRGIISPNSNQRFSIDDVQPVVSKAVTIYSACDRANYFYKQDTGWGDQTLEEVIRTHDPNLLFTEECVGIQESILQPLTTTGQDLEGVFSGIDLGHIDKVGMLNELGLQQASHPSVRGSYIDCFTPASKNQRGYLVTLGEKIMDFTKAMYQCNVFRLGFGTQQIGANTLVADTFLTEVRQGNPRGALAATDVSRRIFSGDDLIRNNSIHGGSYIINIEKGLGDDRYGDIDQQYSDWVSTGACAPIESSDQSLSFDVWGGDAFITKATVKVHESTPKPVCYYPFSAFLGFKQPDGSPLNFEATGDFDLTARNNIPCKTGAYERNVEILEFYVESRVNTALAGNDSIYPFNPRVSGMDTDWENYYNPGYSTLNELKVSTSKEELCKTADGQLTIGYSDQRVRGTMPTPFTDLLGFDRFRVNNSFLLNGRYGPIERIDTLDDNAIYVFQKDRIWYQPIGVDLIRDSGSVELAVGTSEFLGTNGFYAPYDVGACFSNHVVRGDGAFYGLDVKRKKFYGFGQRFGEFRFLSDTGRWDQCLCDFLEGDIAKGDVNMHYDKVEERIFISRVGHGTLVYNIARGYLESRMSEVIDFGFSVDDRLFWIKDGALFEMYGAEDYGVIFDRPQESWVEYIVNKESSQQVIFESIEILAEKGVDAIEAWTYNENSKNCMQHTGRLHMKFERQHHTYFQNLLRDVKTKKRLRGECMRVRVYFSGNDKKCLFLSKTYTRQIP
jgi:hypothetical protein